MVALLFWMYQNVTYTYTSNCGNFFSSKVNYVCQAVRENSFPMGGIQLIFVGDFYQLPPVPNRWTGDPGDHCFQSMIWTRLVPHKVVLKNVQRQTEADLVKAINETARRCPSPDTIALIKSLNNNVARKNETVCQTMWRLYREQLSSHGIRWGYHGGQQCRWPWYQ